MEPLAQGAPAPPVPGQPTEGARAIVFYKVTCPTCQMAAPAIERLYQAFPDRFVAVGQDPPERLEEFGRALGVGFPAVSDAPPYEVSNAYGIRVVPTVIVVDDGEVVDVAESWDREGWNRTAGRLAGALGVAPAPVSEDGDGLPPFRPG